ncbi:CoA-disulfide reductase [Enterococcus nangangensis]|uniref:CoA-disulfide reductase n=1 Tax=Enterococcus nangangensis TaxID=2559926 RepID=UPI0010F814C7|nr:CoA-disulfide reductase [Enterococcus nangangensis]
MKIIVIGGIAAGMSAVAKAQRLLPEATFIVYEKSNLVSFGACGLPYYVGGFFDDPAEMLARRKEDFEKKGVKVNTQHEVLSVNPNEKKLTVKNLVTGAVFTETYDRLMIATGAHPVMPPFNNHEGKENLFFLRTMTDGENIKKYLLQPDVKKVTIIGAGFIGLELVEAMKNRGKEVTVVQLDERVMPEIFDPEFSTIIQDEIVKEGVALHLSESVQGFIGEKKITTVVTNKGELATDLVIVSTGVRPNTAFLKDTGLNLAKNGAIIINHQGQTNLPAIYAAGDCATIPHLVTGEAVYSPLATVANKMGRIVGENLAGQEASFAGTLGTSGLKVLTMEAARTGLNLKEAQAAGFNAKEVLIKDKNQTSYYPDQQDLFIKLVYEATTKRILGGQIAGKKGAVLRIDVLAVAITKGMTTEELGFLDVVYAPPFARTWDALNIAGNVAK